MRELKFRIWSEEDKEYRSDIRVSDLVIDIDGAPSTIYSNEGDRFDIEQYTGLKDKNGKEIYDGDIVQIDDHILGDFEVLWHNLGWTIKRSVGFETLGVHKSEDIVVIGNIHENPELLEEEE